MTLRVTERAPTCVSSLSFLSLFILGGGGRAEARLFPEAEAAREAMMRATAAAPKRRSVEFSTPAERAAKVNAARKAAAAGVGWEDGGGGDAGGGHWTILDGGVTTEQSVTDKQEWDAFDDMDWGEL